MTEDKSAETAARVETLEKKPKGFRARAARFFKEFGDFLKQGDIVNIAVAFVVGAAFRAIVTSLVSDIIMPLITSIGGVSVGDLSVVLNYGKDGLPNMLNYGAFLQTIIDFFIIALAVFVALKTYTRMKSFIGQGAKTVKDQLDKIDKKVRENTPQDGENNKH